MAHGFRLRLASDLNASVLRHDAGSATWFGLSALLVAGALLGTAAPGELLDWQPTLALAQPWRIFSAVAVHYAAAHLQVNLAGALLVTALGWAARISVPMSLAWLLAWPLTHVGLLVDPQLAHYGGLSGVLHAGLGVVAVHLVLAGGTRQRRIGAAIFIGLVIKVGLEFPWTPASFHAELGIMVAPLAHVCGLVAGIACACAVHGLARWKSTMPHA